MSAGGLEEALVQFLNPVNAIRKRAEGVLAGLLKQSTCVGPFVQVIAVSQHESARLVAAVLLRRRINSHWKNINLTIREQVKDVFLKRLVAEASRPVRRAVAALIAALCKHQLPAWPQLLPVLFGCLDSKQVEHREIVVMLFEVLVEKLKDLIGAGKLVAVFRRGLADPSPNVRLEAVKGLKNLCGEVETQEEVNQVSELVPGLLQLANQEVRNDALMEVILELFIDDLPETHVIGSQMPRVANLMFQLASLSGLSIELRSQACSFLEILAEQNPDKLMQNKLVESSIRMAFSMLVEAYDESDVDSSTPQRIACDLLDAVVLNLPKRLVYEPILQFALQLCKSEEPLKQKGGLVAMAVMTEGCGRFMVPQLDQLLSFVSRFVSSPHNMVREAAFTTLFQFAEWIEEIGPFHKLYYEATLRALNNPQETDKVKSRAARALEVFSITAESEALPYIQILVPNLLKALNSNQNRTVRLVCIAAIRSAAVAAKDAFVPFSEVVLRIMFELMEKTNEEDLEMRAKATECVGGVALALGKQRFAPHLPRAVGLALQGMHLEFHSLRESTYRLYECLATVLEGDVVALLPKVMPYLLATMASDDGVKIHLPHNPLESTMDALSEAGSDEDEETRVYRSLNFSIRVGALDEKVAAVSALGVFMKQAGQAFLPFFKDTLSLLKELVAYGHPLLREMVISCLDEVLHLMSTLHPAQGWRQGQVTPLQPSMIAAFKKVFSLLLLRLRTDEDASCVACACDTLATYIRMYGMSSIAPMYEEAAKSLLMLVNEKAKCQRGNREEEGDHDAMLDSLVDLITALAEVIGAQFRELLHALLPGLLRRTAKERSPMTQAAAIGCLADSCFHLKGASAAVVPQAFPCVLELLQSPDAQVRRNAAFAAGVFCTVAPVVASKFVHPLLVLLGAVLEDPSARQKGADENTLAMVDNATSALGKVIELFGGKMQLPLEQIVPVFLCGLPLKADFTENDSVFSCLIFLFRTRPEMMRPMVGKVVAVLSTVLASELDDGLRTKLRQFANFLKQNFKTFVEAALAQLPQSARTCFLQHS